ncbi:hypothetical protein ABGT24_00905 [Peribacillus frigoritolerans]|uniref:hypothetical protein n=1 Tax=Peribacillus frigoritolerans TaxID=450367 RepID=UPI00345CD2E6
MLGQLLFFSTLSQSSVNGYDTNDKPFGNLLAEVKIPYNNKGKAMVGANNLDYIFEKE